MATKRKRSKPAKVGSIVRITSRVFQHWFPVGTLGYVVSARTTTDSKDSKKKFLYRVASIKYTGGPRTLMFFRYEFEVIHQSKLIRAMYGE